MASNFYQWFILAINNFPQVCTKFGIKLRVENSKIQRKKKQKTEKGKVPGGFCKNPIVSLLSGSSARGHGDSTPPGPPAALLLAR